jgi:hypothetical protein
MGGQEPGDVIWTTSAAPLIIHERVVELLTHSALTGWSTYPVEVHSKSGRVVPGYAGLAVSGRCGPVDISRSAIGLRQMPGGWFPYFRGHFFVPDTWDGSDLFMAAPDHLGKVSTMRFLSARGRQVLRGAKVRNLSLIRLTESQTDTSVYTIGLQHLLPADFERRLALAYAEAGVPRPTHI